MKKTEFKVPSLIEADSEYAARVKRLAKLHQHLQELSAEKVGLLKELEDMPRPLYNNRVAELLGEQQSDGYFEKRQRVVALTKDYDDSEAAISILTRLVSEQVGPASSKACAAVRDEYTVRVAAFIEALQAAKAAYDYADEITAALEREGATTGPLQPVTSHFFGGTDNGMTRLIGEAKGAGHVS